MKKLMLYFMALTFGASTLCVEQPDNVAQNHVDKSFTEKVAACYAKTKQALWNHRYKILAVTSVVALAGLAYWYRAAIAAFLGYDVAKASEVKHNATEDSLPKTVPTESAVQPVKPLQTKPLIMRSDATTESIESEGTATPESEVPVSTPVEKTEDNVGDIMPAPSATTTLQSIPADDRLPVEAVVDTEKTSNTEPGAATSEESAIGNNAQQPIAPDAASVTPAETIPALTPKAQPADITELPVASASTEQPLAVSTSSLKLPENTEPTAIEQHNLPQNELHEAPVVPLHDVSVDEQPSAELQQTSVAGDETLDVNWEDQNGVEAYILKNAKRLETQVEEQPVAE